MDTKNLGNISGLAAVFMWSFSAVLVGLSGDVPPFLMAAIVFTIACLIYVIFWIVKKKNVFTIIKQPFISYLVGVGGISGYVGLYYFALKTAPIMEANLINYLWPMFIVIFSAMAFKQKLLKTEILGIVFGFMGAVIVLSDGGSLDLGNDGFYIYLPAIGGAIVWGLYSTFTKIILFDKNFMGVVYGVSAVIMSVLHMLFETSVTIDIEYYIPIALLGLITLSYSFWDFGMKMGDVNFLASVSYFIPFFSTLFLVLFGQGDMSMAIILGGVCILTGCLLSNLPKLRKKVV